METLKDIVRKRLNKWRRLEFHYDALASSTKDENVRDKAWRIRTIFYGRYNECSSFFDAGYNFGMGRTNFHVARLEKQRELIKSLEDSNIIILCRAQETLMFWKAMFNEYNKILALSL